MVLNPDNPRAQLTPEQILEIERMKSERQKMRSEGKGKTGPMASDPVADKIAQERGKIVLDDEGAEILSEIARGKYGARASDRNAAVKLLLTPSTRMLDRLMEEMTGFLAEAASEVAIRRGDPTIASEVLSAFRRIAAASKEAKDAAPQ